MGTGVGKGKQRRGLAMTLGHCLAPILRHNERSLLAFLAWGEVAGINTGEGLKVVRLLKALAGE